MPFKLQMAEIEAVFDLQAGGKAEMVMEMLNAAERPLIVSGGGVINAGASARLQTAHGHANTTMLASDLVIGIGNCRAILHTGSVEVYTERRKFVHIDIGPTRIGHVVGPDPGIVSDAGAGSTG